MHGPDPKCRHFGILAFLPKSLIRNQIRFFRFFPIFSDFFPILRLVPTFRLSDSTALKTVRVRDDLERATGNVRQPISMPCLHDRAFKLDNIS